jgi:hypothetical protein
LLRKPFHHLAQQLGAWVDRSPAALLLLLATQPLLLPFKPWLRLLLLLPPRPLLLPS